MLRTFVLAALLALALSPALAPPASADHAPCIGYERGRPETDDYECTGVYMPVAGPWCIGVYHNHPNPDHPDGCTGLKQAQTVVDPSEILEGGHHAVLLA